MASGKKTMELVQTNIQRGKDGFLYRVVKLTNTAEPAIGETMDKLNVEAFIRRPGWTVIIKGEGSR